LSFNKDISCFLGFHDYEYSRIQHAHNVTANGALIYRVAKECTRCKKFEYEYVNLPSGHGDISEWRWRPQPLRIVPVTNERVNFEF
jgi:hypothetical protein